MDAVFAQMLLYMALSNDEIKALVAEVHRVLRQGGTFVYAVRRTGDDHYGVGIAHGNDFFEHSGFAVHFFARALVGDEPVAVCVVEVGRGAGAVGEGGQVAFGDL